MSGRRGILEPFKPEFHRLLRKDSRLPGVRIRELLEPLGCTASKTVVDDYLREVRPLVAPPPRSFQRTVYRPGEICQFDLWEPREEVPVGHGQTHRGWVVIACLGYSRAGAGVLVFTKQTEDLLAGIAGCVQRLGAMPQTLVWDRQAGLHARDGRPSDAYAGFRGQLKVDWHFCEAADPQAKGAVERLQGFAETNFEPGRVFANELDFQEQLDGWFGRVSARTHKTLRARPIDRLAEELSVMAPLPDRMPDTGRRWRMRVQPDPHLRLDTHDYSLHPGLVGRRVEVTCDQRTVTAVCLDTGEIAATAASLRAIARSPRSSTHAALRPSACSGAAEGSRRSRSARWPATTR